MLQTIHGIWEKDGKIRVLEDISVQYPARVLITVLNAPDTAAASEPALAKDWLREEEEEAWRHLQPEP